MSRLFARSIAGVGTAALVLTGPASMAWAAAPAVDGEDVTITNTETVEVKLDSVGTVKKATLYDQIAVQGSGDVAFVNPVSTVGLRNLDGFGGLTVESGAVVGATSVDGLYRQRTLSEFDQELPIAVSVTYVLDGEIVEPADLVGQSGLLEVMYRVENVTGVDEEISYVDAMGETRTETVTVYTPLAGSLSLEVPETFSDVSSASGGVVAGNGRGGSKVNFSLTLLPPLSQPVAELGFTAQMTDGIVPEANLSVVPVVVDANPTASAASAQYRGGIQTGVDLADGAAQIDENLLKLADGAGQLLAGLVQLRDGADQLNAGLTDTAVPGSQQLAAGLEELSAGLSGTAAPGSKALASGIADLSEGLTAADPKSQELAAGAQQVADGLNGVAVPGSQDLAAGADQLAAGLNTQLAPGAQQVADGLSTLQVGVENLSETVKSTADYQMLVGGVNQIMAQIGNPTDSPADGTALGALNGIAGLSDGATANATGILTELSTASSLLGCATAAPDPACANILAAIDYLTNPADPGNPGQNDLLYQVGAIKQISGMLSEDLYNTDASDPGAYQGLQMISAGIGQLVDSIEDSLNSPELQQLVAGGAQLSAGVNDAAAGSSQVSGGAAQLRDGLQTAAGGSSQVADGAGQLSDGIGAAAAGSGLLVDGSEKLVDGLEGAADGAGQLAEGSIQLADGLEGAADGSQQLADGLGQATESVPALEDGARQLSEEGSQALMEKGNEVAMDFGQSVAIIEASAARTIDGGLPYGAPEGALRSAAYSVDIAGDAGETSQNAARLLAGLAITGAALLGAGLLARRRANG